MEVLSAVPPHLLQRPEDKNQRDMSPLAPQQAGGVGRACPSSGPGTEHTGRWHQFFEGGLTAAERWPARRYEGGLHTPASSPAWLFLPLRSPGESCLCSAAGFLPSALSRAPRFHPFRRDHPLAQLHVDTVLPEGRGVLQGERDGA